MCIVETYIHLEYLKTYVPIFFLYVFFFSYDMCLVCFSSVEFFLLLVSFIFCILLFVYRLLSDYFQCIAHLVAIEW